MKFIDILFASFRKSLPKIYSRFLAVEGLEFTPYRFDWRIEIGLTVRPAKKDHTHVIRHLFSNEIADKGARLTDLFCRHLSVVRRIHHYAQKRMRTSKPNERSRLVYPVHECFNVSRSIGISRWNEQMTQTLAGELICNLHQRVSMPVSVARGITVLAVAKTIIQDASRSTRKATSDPRCKHSLTHTGGCVNNYGARRFYYDADKIRLLSTGQRCVDSLD